MIRISERKLLTVGVFILLSITFVVAEEGSVQTITYHSTTQNTSCNMNVYLPYGYDQPSDSANDYPVFYLIHGGGENYTHWVNSGNAKTTMDVFIASGKAVPMILVMPDGKNLAADVFCNELLNDIIPYIENNYRVKAGKDYRGVGGLSWGGLQAMEAGIYNYQLFGYMSILSSGWFNTDNTAYSRARDFLSANGDDIRNSMRYWYFSQGGSSDIAYENGKETMNVLTDAGLTIHYWEHPGGHQWTAWREDLKSFLPFLFRDSTAKYVALDFQGGPITTATIMTQIDSIIAEPVSPTRTGYTFAGWYKEAEGVNIFDFANDTIRDHFTLYAQWDINSYSVTFNSNGGSAVNDTITALYNTTISAPGEPTRFGYLFDGWYTNDLFIKKWNFDSDKVTKDITLIAKWIEEPSLSVHENDKIHAIIFPNPASSVIQINSTSSGTSVLLFNLEGKLILQYNTDASGNTINIEFLPKGFYLAKILTNDFEYHQKIILK